MSIRPLMNARVGKNACEADIGGGLRVWSAKHYLGGVLIEKDTLLQSARCKNGQATSTPMIFLLERVSFP